MWRYGLGRELTGGAGEVTDEYKMSCLQATHSVSLSHCLAVSSTLLWIKSCLILINPSSNLLPSRQDAFLHLHSACSNCIDLSLQSLAPSKQ
jgi:hypothetical protein